MCFSLCLCDSVVQFQSSSNNASPSNLFLGEDVSDLTKAEDWAIDADKF